MKKLMADERLACALCAWHPRSCAAARGVPGWGSLGIFARRGKPEMAMTPSLIERARWRLFGTRLVVTQAEPTAARRIWLARKPAIFIAKLAVSS